MSKKFTPKNKEELKKLIFRMRKVSLSDIDISHVTDMSGLFYDSFKKRKDFSGIEDWDVSHVTDMSDMFRYCEDFNHDISRWDVSSVENMDGMFSSCENFDQDISKWDVSGVKNMKSMFEYCENFNQDISKWDVSKVLDISYMFYFCKNFNQDLSSWDVLSVENMEHMFDGCEMFNQNISSWDVENVKDMGSMFSGCKNFNQNLSNWSVGSVTDMRSMFAFCENFNQDISKWNVSKVKNMSDMFQYCKNFNQNISSWNTVSVEDVRSIFYKCGIEKSHKPKMLLETFYDDGYKINHDLTDEQKEKIIKYINIYNEAYDKAKNDSLKQLLCCYGSDLKHYKPKKMSLSDEYYDCFDVYDFEGKFRKKKLASNLRRTFYHTLFSICGLREYEDDGIEAKFNIFRSKFEKKFFPNVLSEIIKQMESEDEKCKEALSKLKDFIKTRQASRFESTKEAFEAIDKHVGTDFSMCYFPKTNKEMRKFRKLYKELEVSVDEYEKSINFDAKPYYKAFL